MASKDEKLNRSERSGKQSLHLKLDQHILAALKRESEARGGRQERRIAEEALILYFGLKSLLRGNGFPVLPQIVVDAEISRIHSRIVE
jgi:hypothetical protein